MRKLWLPNNPKPLLQSNWMLNQFMSQIKFMKPQIYSVITKTCLRLNKANYVG